MQHEYPQLALVPQPLKDYQAILRWDLISPALGMSLRHRGAMLKGLMRTMR